MATATMSRPHSERTTRRPRLDGASLSTLTQEELERLLELSSEINELLDLRQVLDRVSDAARDLLDTDMSTVLILDEDRERLEVVAAAGLEEGLAQGLSTAVGHNLAGRVAESGKPTRCCDVPADSRSTLSAVGEAGISSAMLVPLEHHGEVIGVLGVEELERRRFEPREQRVLQLLANHAATAIAKARLYAAEHEHVEELEQLVSRVRDQNSLMTRGREAHERLTRVVLEGLGLHALAETTSELIEVPLALVNRFGSLIHLGDAGRKDPERLWEQCAADPRFAGQLQELSENAGMSEPARVGEPGPWRTVPAVAAGEVLGFIVALEHDQLGEGEMVVLEQAANIVAAELVRERSVADAEARLHGDILGAIMLGSDEGSEAHERAALLGHDLTRPQCVVVVAGAEGEPIELGLAGSSASWACARHGIRGMLASIEGRTVVLLSSGDREVARDVVEGWIESFLGRLSTLGVDAPMRFGVSPVTADPPDVRGAYESAKQAGAVGEVLESAGVTHFDDVELLALLVSTSERESLRRFVHRSVGKLAEYDSERGSSLSETLEVYLDHSGVARHAAKALYLHPHSLRYRLRRIAEIQGIDLSDPTERLMAHLALKLRAVV